MARVKIAVTLGVEVPEGARATLDTVREAVEEACAEIGDVWVTVEDDGRVTLASDDGEECWTVDEASADMPAPWCQEHASDAGVCHPRHVVDDGSPLPAPLN